MALMSEEELALQRLFEKWVKKDCWTVKEAASLFLGIDPEIEDSRPTLDQLQEHIHSAIDSAELTPANKTSVPESVLEPTLVYQWARKSGISLPPGLVTLMDFVLKMTMSTMSAEEFAIEAPAKDNAKDIEKILGGCLAVVTNYPEECAGRSGKMKVELILKILNKHSDKLFEDSYPALSSTAIRDLVNNWVQKLAQTD